MKHKHYWPTVHAVLLGVLLVLIAVNLFLAGSTTKKLIPVKTPMPAPAILTIITADCRECFDIEQAVAALKEKLGREIIEKRIELKDAKEIIAKYGIARVPALILEGATLSGLKEQKNASIFESPPPFLDIASGKVKGILSATLIESDCAQCTSIKEVISQLQSGGLYFKEINSVSSTGMEGKNLIKKFSLAKLPTMLLSSDAGEYDLIKQVWAQVGTIEDGTYVLRRVPPPFEENGRVRGLVTMSLLSDSACPACYNVSMHQTLLEENFNMKFSKIENLDVNSPAGKKVVSKYGITLIPTYVLDKEADAYEQIAPVWSEVGSREEGSYVFRAIDKLGVTYKNLTSNVVVKGSG